jgi:hypothetical protein
MSVVFEVTLDDQPVQLEITHEGELIFLDYNITHDLAALEFGYPKTSAVFLYERWNAYPLDALLRDISRRSIHNQTIALLAADWAEHVLPIYERWHRGKQGPRDLVEASRAVLRGQIMRRDFMHIKRRLRRLGEGSRNRVIHRGEGAIRARLAAYELSTTVVAVFKNKNWSTFDHAHGVTRHAENAAAYDNCDQKDLSPTGEESGRGIGWVRFPPSPEFQFASQAERAWQIRRFVDVMEAIGQGLPWPDIKVTS